MIIKNLTLVIFCFLSVNSFAQEFDANREFKLVQNQIQEIEALCDVPKMGWVQLRKQAMNVFANSSTRTGAKIKTRVRHSHGNKYVLVKYKMGLKAKIKVLYLDGEIQFLRARTRFWISNDKEEINEQKTTKISRISANEIIIYQQRLLEINGRNVQRKYQGKITVK